MEKIISLCQDTYNKCFGFLKPQRPNEYENIELANNAAEEEDERPEKNFFSDWKTRSSEPDDEGSSPDEKPKDARVIMNKKSNAVENKQNLINKAEEASSEPSDKPKRPNFSQKLKDMYKSPSNKNSKKNSANISAKESEVKKLDENLQQDDEFEDYQIMI